MIEETIKATILGEKHLGENLKRLCIEYIDNLQQENSRLKEELEELKHKHYLIQGGRGNCKTYLLHLQKENQELKEVIDKAIELNKQVIKYTKEFYRPTKDKIYGGTLINIAEQNLKILKEVE